MKNNKEIVQRCKKCNTLFKMTILETTLEEPLSYCLVCPACSGTGIYDIIEEPEQLDK